MSAKCQKRTSPRLIAMSALCHKRTFRHITYSISPFQPLLVPLLPDPGEPRKRYPHTQFTRPYGPHLGREKHVVASAFDVGGACVIVPSPEIGCPELGDHPSWKQELQ